MAGLSFAASAGAAPQGKAFSVMAYGDRSFEDIHFTDAEGRVVELAFRPDRRSELYWAPRNASELAFFDFVSDGEGGLRRRTLARADVRAFRERGLLAFVSMRDEARGLPYTVFAASEDEEVFGRGCLRALNVSGATLMARIGAETFALPLGFSEAFCFGEEKGQPQRVAFAVRYRDRWTTVFSTRLAPDPRRGALLALKPPLEPDSLRLRVTPLIERLPPLKRPRASGN